MDFPGSALAPLRPRMVNWTGSPRPLPPGPLHLAPESTLNDLLVSPPSFLKLGVSAVGVARAHSETFPNGTMTLPGLPVTSASTCAAQRSNAAVFSVE